MGDGGVAQANLSLANRLMEFGYEGEPAELARGALELARDRETVTRATAVLASLGDPAEVEPGSLNDDLTAFIDFAPTMLSLCGVQVTNRPESASGASSTIGGLGDAES